MAMLVLTFLFLVLCSLASIVASLPSLNIKSWWLVATPHTNAPIPQITTTWMRKYASMLLSEHESFEPYTGHQCDALMDPHISPYQQALFINSKRSKLLQHHEVTNPIIAPPKLNDEVTYRIHIVSDASGPTQLSQQSDSQKVAIYTRHSRCLFERWSSHGFHGSLPSSLLLSWLPNLLTEILPLWLHSSQEASTLPLSTPSLPNLLPLAPWQQP